MDRKAVFPADILNDKELNANERLILIVIYSYKNAHINNDFPSYSTLAEKTSLHRMTIIKLMNGLIHKGYLPNIHFN